MLSIQNLNKRFGEFSLRDIQLGIDRGDYFVLLGPSGAGKTLLFETIAGIYIPDSGKIILNGRDITSERIGRRNIGLVFQDGAVFPHLSAGENVGYALKMKKLPAKVIGKKVRMLAEQLGIGNLLHRKPAALSGGELKRVAIARTLALDPECLLLDEPLSSIDVQLRHEIMSLLRKLNQSGLTILHITHDYREAFYQANKIAVIDKGRIVQQGTPAEIVAKPASKFIAGFAGIRNYFDFRITGANTIVVGEKLEIKTTRKIPVSGCVVMGQDCISILPKGETAAGENIFEGRITEVVRFPENTELALEVGIRLQLVVNEVSGLQLKEGETVRISIDAGRLGFLENTGH
jgi:ABC-type Fe3+/spermidine/putrescine transport system ATPase subunit